MDTKISRLRSLFAVAAAASLVASVASCGPMARPDDAATSPAAAAGATAAPGTAAAPAHTPTSAPAPAPGKGPACPALRCTSVTITGDMLVHVQLWEQARADAPAAGATGLDFGPLLAAVVESMGAAAAGAHELLISKK
ncbi:MAG: hypothetical protein QOH19_955 [Actinomycetota bacterium]|nr:hypothetical protein [Actinomycetota bacterium]